MDTDSTPEIPDPTPSWSRHGVQFGGPRVFPVIKVIVVRQVHKLHACTAVWARRQSHIRSRVVRERSWSHLFCVRFCVCGRRARNSARIQESILAMILAASRYENQFLSSCSLNYVVNTTVTQNFDSRKSKRNSTPGRQKPKDPQIEPPIEPHGWQCHYTGRCRKFGTSGVHLWLWIKTVKILFWSVTQKPCGLLKF